MSHEEKGYSPDKGAEKSDTCLGAGKTVSEWMVWSHSGSRGQAGFSQVGQHPPSPLSGCLLLSRHSLEGLLTILV